MSTMPSIPGLVMGQDPMMQPMQPMQAPVEQPVQSMQPMQPMVEMQPIQPMQPMQAPVEQLQPAPQVSTETMQPMQAPQAPVEQPQDNSVVPMDTNVSATVAPAVYSEQQTNYPDLNPTNTTPFDANVNTMDTSVAPVVHTEPQTDVVVATSPVAEAMSQPTVMTDTSVSQQQIQQAPVNAPIVDVNDAQSTLLQNGLDLGGLSPEEQMSLNQTPTEAQITTPGLETIGSCSVAAWGGFMKALDFLSKDLSKDDIIVIENGMLDTNREGVFIHCDLQNILGKITLNVINPPYTTKLLKTIKGGNLIQVFADNDKGDYYFCNIMEGRILTKVRSKFATSTDNAMVKGPKLVSQPYIKSISNSEKEILKTIISGKAAIESEQPYRFGFSKLDGTLVSIGVGQDFTYFFQDTKVEADVYKVYYPFPVSNLDSCVIKLYKEPNEFGEMTTWIQTISNIEMASIVCTEKIEIFNNEMEDYSFS